MNINDLHAEAVTEFWSDVRQRQASLESRDQELSKEMEGRDECDIGETFELSCGCRMAVTKVSHWKTDSYGRTPVMVGELTECEEHHE